MERDKPGTLCCGVPVVWVRCENWEDEVWEGLCVWRKREFAYFDPATCRNLRWPQGARDGLDPGGQIHIAGSPCLPGCQEQRLVR